MSLRKGTKLSIWTGAFTFSVFALMLFFRAFMYDGLYIEPGEPYGISDIIELLLGSVLLLAMFISIGLSLVLIIRGPSQNRVSGTLLVIFCITLFFAFSPLHTWAARFGG